MSGPEITPETLARYLKVVAMAKTEGNANEQEVAAGIAAAMREKYPGLDAAAEKQRRYNEMYEKVRRESGMPRASDVVPITGGGVIDMLRSMGKRVTGQDPVKWLVERAERQMEAFVREMAESGVNLDLSKSWEDAYMSLLEQLEAHCVVNFSDAEDERGGTLLFMEIEIPPATFERIAVDPDGPSVFYRFLREQEAASRNA